MSEDPEDTEIKIKLCSFLGRLAFPELEFQK